MYLNKKCLPKILLVADRPNWAYDHICKFIITMLNRKYNISRDYLLFHIKPIYYNLFDRKILSYYYNKYIKYLYKYIYSLKYNNYDIVCYLGWYFPFTGNFNLNSKKIIQGIFTKGFPPQSYTLDINDIDIMQFVDKYLSFSNMIIAGSVDIYNFYKPYLKNKLSLATGAIDTNIFKPNLKKIHKKELIVGWTGNPSRQFKGYYDIILPSIKKIQSYNKDIIFNPRFSGSYNNLYKYYQDIDLLILASIGDAGPYSFIEAGACGIPSISNKSGFPGELVVHNKNGLLVNRNIDEYVNSIDYLYNNRNLLESMSFQIRQDIVAEFSYNARYKNWDNVFMGLINS